MKENIENLMDENKKHHKINQHKKDNNKYKDEIKKLEDEKRELNDKLLRVTAEMQNMRRRYDEEISKIYRYEGEALIKKMLGVLDNFERAINNDNKDLSEELSKYLEGFILIYNDLKNSLNNIGVSELECVNKPFNPEEMEAVMTEKVEGLDSGIVTAVLLKGYKYNDKIIRPAMVKVNE